MNIKKRLIQTERQLQKIQAESDALEQKKQELLQEFLRFDGEHRLLLELQKELPKE